MPEDAYAYLSKITDTSNRMAEMIEQLLMLAKLRDVETTAVTVDLFPLVLAAKSRFENQITQKQIQITIQQEWPAVVGQPLWIEEIFANLIGNAIKYIGGENPAPTVTVRSEEQGEKICIFVEDNGLGIEPQNQGALFDMFTRYHKEEAPGTGLGLPIVERIVVKLGGSVGVDSVIGEGSSFWFTLPSG